ncbi:MULTISPECIES: mycofactocin biosynthesis chaperone MftB [Streptomyces]|uniref:Mycofactocin biosynthesis chaperone MftB n=2 Tax=Streptomyces TaxID=1883 RepID=A0A3R7EKM7_9ACTN|nr:MULTISPECIES: mycofactocin biosynthesis chaperone MftB [Streptomyces]KNE82549.1 mycofactocin system RPExFGAL protein [Streptomyces fradiae]OFA52019.1 mycofactocin system protein MftB [Streptomyces fradiae]PQM23107.1 mycofactocin biosynthesis chaperone MftB [Streptomyces xinghaiensis]RKM91472.1 mycofactocin biosynthesis chaperone MftB [Streptomyces xinghaiensis]RNC74891.1 mycofactocin biosynthesis chaperone MftB [Streptomyces xinghaiensis]
MTSPSAASAVPAFDAARPYRLNPSVALRPEPFGALAYHFGNRRLSFLKAPELVDLVRGLDRHPSVEEALAGVPAARRDALLRALASLAAADMIVPQRSGTGAQ